MGGGYYDREMVYSSTKEEASKPMNSVVGRVNKLFHGLDPKNYVDEDKRIVCQNLNPIVFALDVTGSMGEWPKFIYDKLPMFYGQLKMKNYLEDPAISFCAIGDVNSDTAPLQVSQFGQGKEIDEMIAKLWLQGGGGSGYRESYEFAAYFYNHYVKSNTKGLKFFFITGDELFYNTVEPKCYDKFLGETPKERIDAKAQFNILKKNYNVFFVKKAYKNVHDEKIIYNEWKTALGEQRILLIQNAKACVDTILGAIALTSGRTLQQYAIDMKEKLQDQERIDEVTKALKPYYRALQEKSITIIGSDISQKEHKEEVQYRAGLKNMTKDLEGKINPHWICPITKEVMFDPVMTKDGEVPFERQAIENWFLTHNTLPNSEIKVNSKELSSANMIKKSIRTAYENYEKQKQTANKTNEVPVEKVN